MTLTHAVKAEAQRLGFQLVGVTTPDPPPHLSVFENWLRSNLHGEMGYLGSEQARQRRADPRQILPKCRSILLLGVRYPNPEAVQPVGISGLTGRVASYAWGDDYHDVLPERLESLVTFIEDHVGRPIPNRWYTDTGPILERELAQRAGLGWIGKNTCLIHPRLGSYFLLAEILLGIELDVDAPFVSDHCGSCRRCLEACPTGCILENRTLDARRCISYLTIELKSAIPVELRSKLGEWVFGCDICQQVCPWNQRFASEDGDHAFSPLPGLPHPNLIQEIDLSPQEFNRRFKGSPVKRSKRRGYLRNVAVGLGNHGDSNVVPVLVEALINDPESMVRRHAAWALGEIGGDTARWGLQASLHREEDADVLSEIRAALLNIDGSSIPGD
jgi:epoxyqueuosine reductase